PERDGQPQCAYQFYAGGYYFAVTGSVRQRPGGAVRRCGHRTVSGRHVCGKLFAGPTSDSRTSPAVCGHSSSRPGRRTGASVAMSAFPAIGFFLAVMYPVIFSLALNSVAEHHGSFSGILITGIGGGAVIPLVIGSLGDALGLRVGMFFLYITFGYILSIGFWARPLVTNKTINFSNKKETPRNVS